MKRAQALLLLLVLLPALARSDALPPPEAFAPPAPAPTPAPAAACCQPCCPGVAACTVGTPSTPVRKKPRKKLVPHKSPARGCFQRKELSEQDIQTARIAWKYFERNYNPITGLVNAADGYPSSTLWDLASSLFGIIGAREMGLIEAKEFDDKAQGLLGALGKQRLFGDELPNKAYNAATGELSDYTNQPSERGIGFSAIDIARMMSALDLLFCLHPQHRDTIRNVMRRWKYCNLVKDGDLFGMHVAPDGSMYPGQEGRLGYEQYAARALLRLGFDTHRIAAYEGPHVGETQIYGVPIRHDTRTFSQTGAYNYVLTESYALDELEFGLQGGDQKLLRNVYEVQKQRWKRTGQVTAATEDHIDEAPWFAYNSIFVEGKTWRAQTDSGSDVTARARTVSVKAAFSMLTLFPEDPYSKVLWDKIRHAYDPERGWYSGVYERGGYNKAVTSNTNGIMLEVLLYKMYGPLHRVCNRCNKQPLVMPTTTLEDEPLDSCGPGQPQPVRQLQVEKSQAGGTDGTKPSDTTQQTDSGETVRTANDGAGDTQAASGSGNPPAGTGATDTQPASGTRDKPAGTGAGDTQPASGTLDGSKPASGTGDTQAGTGSGTADGKPASGTADGGKPASGPGDAQTGTGTGDAQAHSAGDGTDGSQPPAGTEEPGPESFVDISASPKSSVLLAPPVSKEHGSWLRLTGNVHAAYSPRGEFVGGVLASWSPYSAFFLRGGLSVAPLADSGQRLRYLWGLGYDNPRESTFTVQLNHWGPITAAQGGTLDVLGSVFHVGYKLPRRCAGPVCGSLYPFIDAPLNIGPAVGARLTFSLFERWYLSAGASYYIPGITKAEALVSRVHPTYGGGYRDWRPGTPSMTFDNWEPNPHPRNAVLSLGINWAL